jgi:signal transduction histidine kinase
MARGPEERLRRMAVLASAAGVGVIQLVGSVGASHNRPDQRPLDWFAVVLLLAGPVALAGRDRRPLLALGVSAVAADVWVAFGYSYGPIFLSVVVALFSAVLAGRRRAAWTVAAAAFVGFMIASWLDPRAAPGEPSLLKLALVIGWVAVVLAVAEVVRARREQAAEAVRQAADERRRRADQRRLQLAQELHDVLAHNISLINVQASVALHLLTEHPEQARPALTNIKAASSEALGELRSALDLLRRGEDAPRAPAARLADLDGLVAGVAAGGLQVRLERDGDIGPLDPAVELAAYRIVQEALTNVTRHAHARHATVRVAYDDGLSIEVVDDGIGAAGDGAAAGNGIGPGAEDDGAAAGNGLPGMRERAVALGGRFEAGPGLAGGFRVSARLPRQPTRSAMTPP